MRIVSLASRTLTPAECNYHMHSGKLEFLALKWAVTEKFRDYLLNGPPFEIVTNNNLLTYVLSTAKLNSTGLRWIAELANFKFSIRYRSGKKHTDADFLSRNIVSDVAMLNKVAKKLVKSDDVVLVMTAAFRKKDVVEYVKMESVEVEKSDLKKIDQEELKDAQKDEDVIAEVYEMVEQGVEITAAERKNLTRDSRTLLKQRKKLSIENGVLVRKTEKSIQIVLQNVFTSWSTQNYTKSWDI